MSIDPFALLTLREKHILLLIQGGKTNGEIGHILGFAHGTVRNYVSTILAKLGCDNRATLAAYAVTHGLEATRFWEPTPPASSTDEAVVELYKKIALYSHVTAARVIEVLS